MLITFNNSK